MEIQYTNKTKDLWFCAFIRLKGYNFVDYIRNDNNKIDFIFNIDNETWKELKIEFNNSELSKAKWEIEKIKDLIF